MKFNVIHPEVGNTSLAIEGKWTVKAGRGTVWNKGFDTWEEAHDFATLKSAEWHMEQAVRLVEQSVAVHPSKRSFTASARAWEKLSSVGIDAQNLIHDIDTWARDNGHQDPDSVERDWLA